MTQIFYYPAWILLCCFDYLGRRLLFFYSKWITIYCCVPVRQQSTYSLQRAATLVKAPCRSGVFSSHFFILPRYWVTQLPLSFRSGNGTQTTVFKPVRQLFWGSDPCQGKYLDVYCSDPIWTQINAPLSYGFSGFFCPVFLCSWVLRCQCLSSSCSANRRQ
jgi:hypothetical protein